MKPYINHCADVLGLLDEKVDSINWNSFYKERKRSVPFITQNIIPDENIVAFLISPIKVVFSLQFTYTDEHFPYQLPHIFNKFDVIPFQL